MPMPTNCMARDKERDRMRENKKERVGFKPSTQPPLILANAEEVVDEE